MTEIVVHESIVYRAERNGESCHFGALGSAKAWAGKTGKVGPIKIRRALLRQIDVDVDKDIEILRLRGYLKKIASQTKRPIVNQAIVIDLVECALRGESLEYVK